MQVRCPHCQTPVELSRDGQLSDIACLACGSSFSLLGTAETARHEAGIKTIGHFDLVEQIGVGTFGVVWKALDTELDRTVAIKIPRKGQLDPGETEQFLREARAAAQLRHPNIVSVHEVGRDQDTVFIVSDFVEGVTLADRLTVQKFSCREAQSFVPRLPKPSITRTSRESSIGILNLGTSSWMPTGSPTSWTLGLLAARQGK